MHLIFKHNVDTTAHIRNYKQSLVHIQWYKHIKLIFNFKSQHKTLSIKPQKWCPKDTIFKVYWQGTCQWTSNTHYYHDYTFNLNNKQR